MSFLLYLKLAQPRLPGTIKKITPNGSAFVSVAPALPLSSGGPVTEFFVPNTQTQGLKEGAHVTFRWHNPGERGFDKVKNREGNPRATGVETTDGETWLAASRALRIQREALDGFSTAGLDGAKLRQLLSAFKELPAEPHAALLVAIDLFVAAKELVDDEARVREELDVAEARLMRMKKTAAKAEADLKREEARLAPLRVFFDDFNVSVEPRPTPHSPAESLNIDDLEARVGSVATPLVRRTAIVATLCAALEGRLLLLDGPVGTGKTTLAERVASACGGAQKVIPVRPAWIEPEDLVGYYDPLSRLFRPGPLVEALTVDPVQDRLFATVLDELNLARIENYASDLLSRLERLASAAWTNDSTAGVPVWSGAERRALKAEMEILAGLAETSPKQAHRLQQLRQTISYSSQLALPDGVVFLGTLNTDDTTYDLSPKVIDRAYAIAFPRPHFRSSRDEASKVTSGLSISALRVAVGNRLEGGSNESVWKSALTVIDEDQMAQVGVPYSHRVFRDARVFEAVSAELGIEQEEAAWMFIFSRVFPRVRCFNNNERADLLKGVLDRAGQRVQGDDRAWFELIDRLTRQLDAGEGAVVRFWRGAFH